MGGYLGLVSLGATLQILNQCHSGSMVASNPDGTPSFAIYDSTGTSLLTGNLGGSNHDSKTGLRRGTAAITAGNSFAAGGVYTIRVAYQVSSVDLVDLWTFNVV